MLLMNRRFSPLMSSESVPLSSSFAKESLSLYSKSSRKPKSIPRLRKNFPETWIWTNLSAEYDSFKLINFATGLILFYSIRLCLRRSFLFFDRCLAYKLNLFNHYC